MAGENAPEFVMESKITMNPDIVSLPEATVASVHKQAEDCLAGTVALAIAADARATTLTGIFGGAAVALLAGGATILAAPDHQAFIPLLASVCTGALFLLAAALLSAYACRPVDFFVGGYEPKLLSKSAQDMTWLLKYATNDVQVRIDTNRETLASSARKVNWAMGLALLAVLAGILVFFAVRSI